MPTASLELDAPTRVETGGATEDTAATRRTPSPDDLVHAHLGLARRIVSRLAPRLPAHVGRDDLHAAGLLGLVNAAQSYDAARGVPFELYAGRRIEGAVLDELRRADWATRGVRRRERQIDEATGPLAMMLHRAPTTDEVAAATGLAVDAVQRFQVDRTRAALLQLERLSDSGELERSLPPSSEGDPERRVLEQEHLDLIARAVDALPVRLRRVVRAQFFDGMTGAQLADELDVSAARVLQLRREALVLLSHALDMPQAPVRAQDRRGQPSARRVAAYRAAFAASPRRQRPSQVSRMPLAAARATAARGRRFIGVGQVGPGLARVGRQRDVTERRQQRVGTLGGPDPRDGLVLQGNPPEGGTVRGTPAPLPGPAHAAGSSAPGSPDSTSASGRNPRTRRS